MSLIKVTPDREKARSILEMAERTLEMISQIDLDKFPSIVIKEYYDVIRELISVLALFDGFKTVGEGAHIELIRYLEANYSQINGYDIALIDRLRILRNRITYNGFFVSGEYVRRKRMDIEKIVLKLKSLAAMKLRQ